MKPNTCLVADLYEGSLEIDEPVLKANGVAGMIIRLNDMNGGHHLDTGFSNMSPSWAGRGGWI
jgi:aspartate 1-decarboxylase